MSADAQRRMTIEDDNLSRAWSRAFLHVLDHPGTEIAPLLVSVTGFTPDGDPSEESAVRSALDACLAGHEMYDVATVAWTIFPRSLWRIAKYDRHRLFDLYKETFPRYKAMNPHHNRRGLYFERLIAYGRGPFDGNQLEWIINEFQRRRSARRTKFQASIFDPGRDHVPDAQLGFPCLQHVALVPCGQELTVNAFYATQQLFDKAYGNWLGLCHLGHFMAHEMGLTLARLNCFIGIEKLERISKSDPGLRSVEDAARACLVGIPMSASPVGVV